MNYYINKNKVKTSEDDLSLVYKMSVDFNDSYECYVKLNEEQITFYLSNPNLSTKEIFLMKINPVTPPDINNMITLVYRNYERVETSNITPVGAIQLLEWCMQGNIKALAVKQWLVDLYAERNVKLNQLENGIIVNLEPSLKNKPYSFREMGEL